MQNLLSTHNNQSIKYNQNVIYDNLLKVEISSICNSKCVWCWMHNSHKVKKGFMSLDSFKHFVDINENFFKNESKGIWQIEPFFNGESLVNPYFLDMMEYVIQKKVQISNHFDTNLSVEIDIQRFMSIPWKGIWVNIGGITKDVHEKNMKNTKFEIMIKNLTEILKIRSKNVYLKMIPTKNNIHQINQLSNFFSSLGGDPQNIIQCSTGFTLPSAASYEDKEYFFSQVVSDELKNDHLRFTYDLTKNDFGIKAKRPGCNFLVPGIAFDGRVTTCCHDQLGEINVGNAFEKPIEEILSSEFYIETIQKCLKQEFYFCQDCN